MTEINRYKEMIELAKIPVTPVIELEPEELQDLLTTIESQKEEIELKDSEYQATITKLNKLTQTINSHGPEGRNYTNQQYVDLLQKFESLKAITELAVKGLEMYANEGGKRAKRTLSEIEKLQK